jgi:hypothetical protein
MKKTTAICIGLAFAAAAAFPAYAGTWRQNASGWWYLNDDGTYPAGGWQWIDSDGDGTAECYYFDADGYMASSKDIDGYHVNDAGQWTVGDNVQRIAVSGAAASSAADGRDMSYAEYCRGINSLWADATEYGIGYYDIYLGISPETMTDLGDCWKVDDVQVYRPYEYGTESEAQEHLEQLIRSGSFEYSDGMGSISRNASGTWSIYGIYGVVFSYQVWSGSVYIRKDAEISYTNYDSDMKVVMEPFGTYYARESQSQWFYSVSCVISAVDENGYITVLRLAQWG